MKRRCDQDCGVAAGPISTRVTKVREALPVVPVTAQPPCAVGRLLLSSTLGECKRFPMTRAPRQTPGECLVGDGDDDPVREMGDDV